MIRRIKNAWFKTDKNVTGKGKSGGSTAQELGVSITPVREAFQILERDGLIDLQQNKGATVLGINETTLREHFQIRAALESEACVLCCKNRIDMSRIEQVLTVSKEMIEKQDYENYSKLNQSLHMEIWIAAGNEKLKKMLSELWSGLSMGVKMTGYCRKYEKMRYHGSSDEDASAYRTKLRGCIDGI